MPLHHFVSDHKSARHSLKSVPCRSGGTAMLMSLAHLSLWSVVVGQSPERSAPVSRVYRGEYRAPAGWQTWEEGATTRRLVVLGPVGQMPTILPPGLSGWASISVDQITAWEGRDAMPPSPLSFEGRCREWLQE